MCNWIFRKTIIWESVSFQCEMFDVKNFEKVLRIGNVNTMIFINKQIGKLVQDCFLQIVNDPQYDNFAKIYIFLKSFIKLNVIKKNTSSLFKIRFNGRSGIFEHKLLLKSNLKKKKQAPYYPWIFL